MPHKSQISTLIRFHKEKKNKKKKQKHKTFSVTSAMENCYTSPCADFDSSFQLSSDCSQFLGYPPWPVEGVVDDRSLAASSSRSHSQAEKRRRDRINAQLAALKKLIPKSDKMDKAALLGSAVEHLKDLKEKTVGIYDTNLLPTEADEVTVDSVSVCSDNGTSGGRKCFIKASVCCEDRPEVLGELIRVIRGLKLNTVKAEISSVGGRIRNNMVLCNKNGEDDVVLSALRQSLNAILSRISSASVNSNFRIRSKRQRLLFSTNFSQ